MCEIYEKRERSNNNNAVHVERGFPKRVCAVTIVRMECESGTPQLRSLLSLHAEAYAKSSRSWDCVSGKRCEIHRQMFNCIEVVRRWTLFARFLHLWECANLARLFGSRSRFVRLESSENAWSKSIKVVESLEAVWVRVCYYFNIILMGGYIEAHAGAVVWASFDGKERYTHRFDYTRSSSHSGSARSDRGAWFRFIICFCSGWSVFRIQGEGSSLFMSSFAVCFLREKISEATRVENNLFNCLASLTLDETSRGFRWGANEKLWEVQVKKTWHLVLHLVRKLIRGQSQHDLVIHFIIEWRIRKPRSNDLIKIYYECRKWFRICCPYYFHCVSVDTESLQMFHQHETLSNGWWWNKNKRTRRLSNKKFCKLNFLVLMKFWMEN